MLKRESSLFSPWEGSKSLFNDEEADRLYVVTERSAGSSSLEPLASLRLK